MESNENQKLQKSNKSSNKSGEKGEDKDLSVESSTKSTFKHVLGTYAFILPSLITLILFIFIPIIFSFLISFYSDPGPVALSQILTYMRDLMN